VAAWREVIFNEMDLGLDDGKFVVEVLESVVGTSVPLDFSGHIPVVEVSDGATEGVVCGGRAIEEGVEPNGGQLGDVGRWVVWGEEEFNGVRVLVMLFPATKRAWPSSLSRINLVSMKYPSPTGICVETRPLFGS
jgi:hypothetical protein